MKKRSRKDEDNGFFEWGGYMEAKKAKLQEQFKKHANKEARMDIFRGVAIFVNGYTVPSADDLKRIMMVHGGDYHHYQMDSTTHVIANNLPDCKVKLLKVMKVVTPKWITDSVQAGKLLDYRQYLLYSHQSKSQPQLTFSVVSVNNCGGNAEDVLSCKNVHIVHSEKSGAVESVSSVDSIPLDERMGSKHMMKSKHFSAPCAMVSDKLNVMIKSNKSSTTSTAVNPSFLSEFYSNSRLHHISTMGTTLKEYVCKLQEQSDGKFSGLKRLQDWKRNVSLMTGLSKDVEDICLDIVEEAEMLLDCNSKVVGIKKTIMHIDMDCFFVSVGLRSRPELRGMPVAVTHGKGNNSQRRDSAIHQFELSYYKQRMENKWKQKHDCKNQNMRQVEGAADPERFTRMDNIYEPNSMSEIASCSYEARKAGLKNGMFLGSALKLCPNLKTIPYDFHGYKEVSFMLYDTVASYTLAIEAVSCDELFVDCTDVLEQTGTSALEFATFLRSEIKTKTGCPASTGFGSNLLQARLATRRAKPDGQFYLRPENVANFMLDIKVEDLPGVGHILAYRLHNLGISTCHQLQDLTLVQLQTHFGTKTGESLFKHSRGQDDRLLITTYQRKSVSAEINYGIRFQSQDEVESFLQQLSYEVQAKLTDAGKKGRCITLKLMVRTKDAPMETAKYLGHGACDHITRSSTLTAAVVDADTIAREVVLMQRQLSITPSDLRGIGVQVSRLENITRARAGIANFFFRNRTESKATDNINKYEKLNHDVQSVDTISSLSSGKPNQQFVRQTLTSALIPTDCGLEEEVATTLPEDNQCEIWKQHQQTKEHIQRESPLLQACTPAHLKEILALPLQEMHQLAKTWVAMELEPQPADVLVLASHGQHLAANRSLDALQSLLRLLYRCIMRKQSCKWQEAYHCILDQVQHTMQQTYGAKLKAAMDFPCGRHMEPR